MAFEPVDIEFAFKSDPEGINKAKDSIRGLGNDSEEVLSRVKVAGENAYAGMAKASRESVAEQKTVIKQVEADIKAIEKQLKGMAPGHAKLELQAEATAAKKALNEEKVMLAAMEQQLRETEKANVAFRAEQLRTVEAMNQLRRAGKESSEEYDKLKQKLGEMRTVMRTTAAESKAASTGGATAAGMVSGISGVAGAASAAVGVLGLFNTQNERLAAIQTRVQALMAITIGLQQVSTTLHQASAFRITIVAGAKNLWTAATARLNTQLGISLGLSRALMVGGIGLLMAGVALLVSKLQDWKKKQQEVNTTASLMVEIGKEASKETAKRLAEIDALRAALKHENTAYGDKINALNKLKGIIPGYNAEVSKSGKFISENTTKVNEYIAALNKQMYVQAAQQKLVEAYNKKLNIDLQIKDKEQQKQEAVLIGEATSEAALDPNAPESLRGQVARLNTGVKRASKQLDKDIKELQKQQGEAQQAIDGINRIISENAPSLLAGSTDKVAGKAASSQYKAQSELQKLLRDIQEKTTALQVASQQEGLKRRLEQLDAEEAAEVAKVEEKNKAIVDAYNKANQKNKATSITQIDNKEAKAQEDAMLALKDAYAKKRVFTEDEAQKEMAQLRKDYSEIGQSDTDRELSAITEKYRQIRKEAAALSKDGSISQADNDAINNAEQKEQALVLAKKVQQYAGYLGERATLEKAYLEDMAALELALAGATNEKELALAKEAVAKRKEQYSQDSFSVEVKHDKKSDIFGIGTAVNQIAFLRKQLAEAKMNPQATEEVERLNAELDKATAKVAEGLGEGLKLCASTLGQLGALASVFDEDLGKTIDSVGKLVDGAADIATGAGRLLAGDLTAIPQVIGGVVSVATEIKSLFDEGAESARKAKEEMEAWAAQQFIADHEMTRIANERLKVEDIINKTRMAVIDEEKKLLAAKKAEAQRDLEASISKLEGEQYKSGQHTEKYRTTGDKIGRVASFGAYKGKSGTRVVDEYSDIAGYLEGAGSAAEKVAKLQELYERGMLNDEQKKYFEDLKRNYELIEAYQDDLIKKEEERKELVTGTTRSALADNITQGLAAGKTEFADFANDVEEMLRKSLLSAMSAKFFGSNINELYERFSEAFDDGVLSEQEATAFRQGYSDIVSSAKAALDAMNQAGIDMQGGSSGLQNSVKSITENSASLIAGQMNAIRVNVAAQLQVMNGILADVQRIRASTDSYLPYLAGINAGITALKTDLINGVRAAS